MDNTFKGTPGPWLKETRTSKRSSTRICAIIPKRYGERVIERELILGHISDDDCGIETCCCIEEHSNAKLIASAPELLEALNAIVNRYEYVWDLLSPEAKNLIENGRKVIDKIIIP